MKFIIKATECITLKTVYHVDEASEKEAINVCKSGEVAPVDRDETLYEWLSASVVDENQTYCPESIVPTGTGETGDDLENVVDLEQLKDVDKTEDTVLPIVVEFKEQLVSFLKTRLFQRDMIVLHAMLDNFEDAVRGDLETVDLLSDSPPVVATMGQSMEFTMHGVPWTGTLSVTGANAADVTFQCSLATHEPIVWSGPNDLGIQVKWFIAKYGHDSFKLTDDHTVSGIVSITSETIMFQINGVRWSAEYSTGRRLIAYYRNYNLVGSSVVTESFLEDVQKFIQSQIIVEKS